MSNPENLPVPAEWTLREQSGQILQWVCGDEALRWCARCCRRFGLPDDMAGDVRSASWIRLQRTLERRQRPLENMSTIDAARRYAARACENTAIDFGRSVRRRAETVALMDGEGEIVAENRTIPLAESRLALEDLRRTVVTIARDGVSCAGCPADVVLASALWVINAQIQGDNGTLSEMLYESLQAVDTAFPENRGDAARQRKSRCGRCVVALLRSAIEVMEAKR